MLRESGRRQAMHPVSCHRLKYVEKMTCKGGKPFRDHHGYGCIHVLMGHSWLEQLQPTFHEAPFYFLQQATNAATNVDSW